MGIRSKAVSRIYWASISATAISVALVWLDARSSQFDVSRSWMDSIASVMARPGYFGAGWLGVSGHDVVRVLPAFLVASVLFYTVAIFSVWSAVEWLSRPPQGNPPLGL